MSGRLDWEKARSRDLVRARGSARVDKRPQKARGISNDQARELARLQRAAGEPYSGSGMTARQASAEIRRLKGV